MRNQLFIVTILVLSVTLLGISCSTSKKQENNKEISVDSELLNLDMTFSDYGRFDSIYNSWKITYNKYASSNKNGINDAKDLPQYMALLSIGKKIIPSLIIKLSNNDLLALLLYDDLQEIDSLKSFDYNKGNQYRAKETVRKYIESKINRKKRIFNSKEEKIRSIKELAKKYGWKSDIDYTTAQKDSMFLNIDYEIAEEVFKSFGNNSN